MQVQALHPLEAVHLVGEFFELKKDWPLWFREIYDHDRDRGLNCLWPDWAERDKVLEEATEEKPALIVKERYFERFWFRGFDGLHVVQFGDYLIKDRRGDIHVVTASEFAKNYQIVR